MLYECLGGCRPFDGETASDLIARILEREPDWKALPPNTPATVQLLVRRCLAKDRNRRLHDIADARIELEQAIADPTSSSLTLAGRALAGRSIHRSARRMATLIAGAALVGVLATLGGLRLLAPITPAPTVRKFNIPVPRLVTGFDSSARISHDGRRIVYSSGSRLWVRDLQRFDATEVPGSEDAISAFWSSDGMQLGFAKEKRIWTDRKSTRLNSRHIQKSRMPSSA